MQCVILSGGFGTRMRPATLKQNKHLLPVYTKDQAVPMIFYPIQTFVNSGIKDILIVSSREYCGNIIENLGDGSEFNASFTYEIQDHNRVQLGIASALKLAENFVKDEQFAVVLGDNYFADTFTNEVNQFILNLDRACIFLKEVPDIKRFGCATVENGKVVKIVEKPTEPESNWAVTGLYFYTKDVFKVAKTLVPSKRGELEITDINNHYCEKGTAKACFLNGFWSDMGTPESMRNTQDYLLTSSNL